jgi:hypothetical protein
MMTIITVHRTTTEWAKIFSDIYSEADKERTPEQIWIAIMAHASVIGESIRTFSVEKLSKSAAHTFCWLCSFINKCNELKGDIFSLEEPLYGVVTLKYPSKCGHCEADPCTCPAKKLDDEDNKSAKYSTLLEFRRPNLPSYSSWSIVNFLDTFRHIYEGRVHIQTLETIGFHFLEEVGEAAVAVRNLSQLRSLQEKNIEGLDPNLFDGLTTVEKVVNNYQEFVKDPKRIILTHKDPEMLKMRVIEAKMALIVEIGDTFSWFCGILNKMLAIEKSIWVKPDDHPDFKFQDLETALKIEYINEKGEPKCPTCGVSPCSCAFYNE